MSAARIRLVIAAVLFCGWLSWLTYLAATSTSPIVLSRPQFLTADAWVIATVSGADVPDGNMVVKKVVWVKDDKVNVAENKSIKVLGLKKATLHWQGPGDYIVPLTMLGGMGYRLNPIPFSPGYGPTEANESNPHRMYPVTPGTQEQLNNLLKSKQ